MHEQLGHAAHARYHVLVRFVLVVLLAAAAACSSAAPIVDGGRRAQVGDVALAAVAYDEDPPADGDPRWVRGRDPLQRRSVFWLRVPVVLDEATDPASPLGVAASMLASYELYWDGQLIARSGRVGASRADELPGSIDGSFALPASAAGAHVLMMRLSNFHDAGDRSNSCHHLKFGAYRDLLTTAARTHFPPLLVLGWLVLTALLLLGLYVAQGRRPAALLFAATCVLVAGILLGQVWRWLVGYTYDDHLTRLAAGAAASLGVLVLLPFAWACELQARRKWPIVIASLAAALVGMIAPSGYNPKAAFMLAAATVIAIVVAAAAAVRRQQSARLALAALILCLAPAAVAPARYHDVGFVIGFSGMIVALLVILGRRMIDERHAAAQATLRSARLELELVKRGIQPHFLMNVLTSILEWIEQEPARASRFVVALADELSLLTRASGHALIPIELELELCRAHVALMSQRLEVEVTLAASGIAPSDRVPPALFHTLIENAMTHGSFAEGPVQLVLEAARTGAHRRYRLLSPEIAPPPASREGTGSRYVRARLQESYSGRWRVHAGPCAAGWETVIEIEDV